MDLKNEIMTLLDINGDNKIDNTDLKFFGKYFGGIFTLIGGIYTTITGVTMESLKELNGWIYLILALVSLAVTFVIVLVTAKDNEKKKKLNKAYEIIKQIFTEKEDLVTQLNKVTEEKSLMEIQKDFTIRIASAIAEYNDIKVSAIEGMIMKVLEGEKEKQKMLNVSIAAT